MMKVGIVLAIVGVLLYLLDAILLIAYCTAGFLGYPDIWSSRAAKKIYFATAPLSIVLVIAAAVILVAIRL